MICRNCGLDAGETTSLLSSDIICAGCGYKPPTPVKNGQKRVFLQDIKMIIPYTATLAHKGDIFTVKKVKKIDTYIKYKGGIIKELNTKYILEKTEVIGDKKV